MRRVPDVIDCWFDSGAMPFAQWGYPRQEGSPERFSAQFPADFISEAIDQTRGWFYSLLAISTLLFSEERRCSGLLSRRGTDRARQVRSRGDQPIAPAAPSPQPSPGEGPGSLSPSLPQLHRAGPDAGRRRQ